MVARRNDGLSPITLNLIDPRTWAMPCRCQNPERDGDLRRNVDHSATDERSPANDRDRHRYGRCRG